ncbi:FHA domain-containing protein PS1 isoform X2 [Prosopis cineraria]|uniref:FHA domain-containing protein PS1 isoform X2 n=1 Tax=Prosopis cineraria TaxID=364024 RepID=UPI00240FFDCB|nr:FHA domain-containing protein PS1 isoform X2 [Prosopis cineraria]
MAKTLSLPEAAELKIPVFTVLKNGAILKNVFIVNKSPEPEPLASSVLYHDRHDHILIVGRHPDCNIMLTHPSISRFHLQIQSNPCSQKLFVIDLSSVHGTWVSGRKIEPGMRVEMKEGDTLRIGASSRLYRLHWIPISRAYDLENPFASELDMTVEAEKGQEDDALPDEEEEEEEEEEMTQDESFCQVDNEEVQSVDSILESIYCLFTDENLEFIAKKEIPSQDSLSFYCHEEENCPADDHPGAKTTVGLFGTEISYVPTNYHSQSKVCDTDLQVLSPPHVSGNLNTTSQGPQKMPNFSVNRGSLFHVEEEFQGYSEAEVPKETNILSTLGDYLRESICLPVVEAVQGTKMQQFQDDQQIAPLGSLVAAEMPRETRSVCTLGDNDRGAYIITSGAENLLTDSTFLTVEEATRETKFQPIDVALDSLPGSEEQIHCCQDRKPNQNSIACHEQGHSMDGIVQAIGDNGNNNISFISLPAESSITSLSEESNMEISNKKENQTQQFLAATAGCSEKKILEKSAESTENDFLCNNNNNIWSRRGKATSAPQIQTSKSRVKSKANVDNQVEVSYQKDIKKKAKAKDVLSVSDGDEEEEIFTPDKENFSPNALKLRFQKKGKLEEIKHFKSRQRSHNSKDYLSPEIYLGEIPVSEKENLNLEVAHGQKSERKPFGSYIKLEQNVIDMSNQENITDKTVPKNLLSDLDEEEEEYHTLDKENFSPNTLQLLLLENKSKLEEPTHSKLQKARSSNANFISKSTSGKENQTSVAREQKSKRRPFGSCIELGEDQGAVARENRLERLPLQSLLTNSGGKSRPETSRSVSAAKNISAITCAHILDESNNPSHVSERSWNMVVDTASLLNKESRKALMLLQGLKGTRLIIPRIVIKELDGIKRQFSFFRRTSEASLALEWIEECMMKTKWWIHVQSSIDEGMLIAPTPPATPRTQFNEEGWNFYLSSHKSSMEIVSPTTEDHILDYVLTHRRKQNDGQFVLLSDDVTLKIKSMAEGLPCETVQEFRDSLVNPFSERFLWVNSSPRGQTWCCQDDVVLRQKYYRFPSRKSSKGEGAKGLKLILLHNSRYRPFSSAR